MKRNYLLLFLIASLGLTGCMADSSDVSAPDLNITPISAADTDANDSQTVSSIPDETASLSPFTLTDTGKAFLTALKTCRQDRPPVSTGTAITTSVFPIFLPSSTAFRTSPLTKNALTPTPSPPKPPFRTINNRLPHLSVLYLPVLLRGIFIVIHDVHHRILRQCPCLISDNSIPHSFVLNRQVLA